MVIIGRDFRIFNIYFGSGVMTVAIVHIMKDGTVRSSIEGIVIHNKEFYQVLRGITEKQEKVQSETR